MRTEGTGEPRFGVLGPLLIEVDGRPVPPPGSAVVRGLLGVLLVAGERPLTTEQLIELVWTDRADRTGRGPVQAAVSRLRDWLSRLPGDTPPIEYDGGGYRPRCWTVPAPDRRAADPQRAGARRNGRRR